MILNGFKIFLPVPRYLRTVLSFSGILRISIFILYFLVFINSKLIYVTSVRRIATVAISTMVGYIYVILYGSAFPLALDTPSVRVTLLYVRDMILDTNIV